MIKIPPHIRLSPPAADAIKKIEALQRYPVEATEIAVQRVLSKLNPTDLIIVTSLLAANDGGIR